MTGRAWRLVDGFGLQAPKLGVCDADTPGPGQLRLRVAAVSLNYRDLMVVQGTYDPRLVMPRVLLSDCVARVDGIGEGVLGWAVGDRVCPVFAPGWHAGEPGDAAGAGALGHRADGVARDFVCVSAADVVAVPPHLSDAEAATLPCAGVTAWHALSTLPALGPEATIVVQGTGGVSMFALQIARLRGARVIVTSASDEKRARAQALGASHTVNYRDTPRWSKAVRALTGGMGADLVVEVGGVGTLAESLSATRNSGTICVIGVLSGRVGEVDLAPVLMRNLRLQGVFVGHRGHLRGLCAALAARPDVRPVIDRTFDFEALPDALAYLEKGAHVGKVVLTL